MKKFYQEFKNFAIKGNMIDMAIGIIIGTAFNKVVSILVKKIILPPLTYVTSGVSMVDKKFVLSEATDKSSEIAIGYGELFESLVDFLIVSLTIFVIVKAMNKFKDKAENPEDVEVKTPKDIELLSKIEKLLENQNKILVKGKLN